MFFTKEPLQIDVYYMNIPKDSSHNNQILQILNKEEQSKYLKCKGPKRKKEILYGRAFLKTILGYYLNKPAEQIMISVGEHGKLYYGDNRNGVNFNIAHTDDIITGAFSFDNEVGIDIEKKTRNVEQIAMRFFSKGEIEYIEMFPREERNNIACKLWTLKEAYVKAKGMGLLMPLDSFNVLEENDIFSCTKEIMDKYYLSVVVENTDKLNFDIRIKEINCNSLIDISRKTDVN